MGIARKRLNGKPDALKEARPVWGEVQRNVLVVTQATRCAPTPRDPTPSPEDIEATKQLVAAGRILDIELVDHLIIGHLRWE
jgi:RadC-like JAB domain